MGMSKITSESNKVNIFRSLKVMTKILRDSRARRKKRTAEQIPVKQGQVDETQTRQKSHNGLKRTKTGSY